MNLSKELSLSEFAKLTEGATGADIKAICTEAGLFAIRDDRDLISRSDFLKAIDKLLRKEGLKNAASGTYL